MTEVTDKVIKGSANLLKGTANVGTGLLKDTANVGKGLLRGTAGFGKDLLQGTADVGTGLLNDTAGLGKNIINQSAKASKGLFKETLDTGTGFIKGTADAGLGLVKDTGRLASNTVKRTGKVASRLLKGDIKGTLTSSGKLVTGTFNEIVDDIEGTLDTGLSNKYVSTTLKVLLAFYAAFAAPNLPRSVASLLDHTVVRILIAILIVFVATKDASLAILVSLAFVLSLQTANKYKLIDTSRSISVPGKLSWLPSQQGGGGVPLPHHHQESQHAEVSLPTHPVMEGQLPSVNIGTNDVNSQGIARHQATEHFTGAPIQPSDPNENYQEAIHPGSGHQGPVHHEAVHQGAIHTEAAHPGIVQPDAVHTLAPAHHVEAESMFSHHPLPEHAVTTHQQPHPSPHVGSEHAQLSGVPLPEHVSMEHLPQHHATEYADIQTNRVPGANQSSCTQSWSNENCPQGLNDPSGFGGGCDGPASFQGNPS